MSQEFPQFAQQTLANALNWFSPTHRLWDRVWAAPTEHGRKNKTRNSWRVLRKPRLEMLLDYPHKSRRAYLYALWCISSARYTPYPSVNHPDKTIQHCAQPLPSLSFCGIRFTNLSRNQWGEIADSVLRLSSTRCIDVSNSFPTKRRMDGHRAEVHSSLIPRSQLSEIENYARMVHGSD